MTLSVLLLPLIAYGQLRLTPLTDFVAGQTYKGESGGLYGSNKNAPPRSHASAALVAATSIVPRDALGAPSSTGRIALVSIGMSNTTQEFSTFIQVASGQYSPKLTLVDGAQGGQTAHQWATNQNTWNVLTQRLTSAGISDPQVQAVWVKLAQSNPASLGAYPAHADNLRADTAIVMRMLKQRFVNLRIAYVSSRIYAGYATTQLNPEPYAYESAFAMRRLILDQIGGDPGLNYNPFAGPVVAPVILWGPYLWANGPAGRLIDNLVWLQPDFAADGTHPSTSGRTKVANLLLAFFQNEPTSKWFKP